MQLGADSAIRRVALEIEAHAKELGWDQPARLYALVPTVQLITHEPALAASLGLDSDVATDDLTPIEQDRLPSEQSLEQMLMQMTWPEQVHGCAAVLERLMLPPDAEADLPDDPEALASFVAGHPDRYDVRIVAAVSRAEVRHSTVRLRDRPDDELLEGPDLVPTLTALLSQTLAQ